MTVSRLHDLRKLNLWSETDPSSPALDEAIKLTDKINDALAASGTKFRFKVETVLQALLEDRKGAK